MQKNLASYRGDSVEFPISFVDPNGAVIPITGWTIFFTLKQTIDDVENDSAAKIAKTVTTHTDPVNGLSEVDLSQSDTHDLKGVYFYDFKFLTATGDIVTFLFGEWEFIADVTRRIA